jgi:ABC-type transport system involved in multi-copper enzyme maturation permease subunit
MVKGIPFTGDDLLRLAGFLLVSLIFIGVYAAMGICVSAKASSSGQSLVILLGLWILTTYCIPGISSSLSQSLAPAPESRDIQRKQNDIWISGVFKLAEESEYGGFTRIQRQQSNRAILAETRRLENEYFSQMNAQNRLFRIFARTSPAASYVELSTSLLGNGLDAMNQLRKEIRNRRDMVAEQENADAFESRVSEPFPPFGQSLADSVWILTLLILTGVLLSVLAVVLFNNAQL